MSRKKYKYISEDTSTTTQEGKKNYIILIFEGSLHGGDLIVYRHDNRIVSNWQIGIRCLDIGQYISNARLPGKGDPNLVGMSVNPLQT